MRLAFVVQRYGDEVAGGAEALCRATARALAEGGDEVVVYTFTTGATPGAVRWKADKIVDGRRKAMGGALDAAYDPADACWKAEVENSRVHVVWCFTVRDGDLSGSAWLLPGKQTVCQSPLSA